MVKLGEVVVVVVTSEETGHREIQGATCVLLIRVFSIRMEEKGGRNFRKLGFTDINLAEYAGVGLSTQRYILQPYDLNHRLGMHK